MLGVQVRTKTFPWLLVAGSAAFLAVAGLQGCGSSSSGRKSPAADSGGGHRDAGPEGGSGGAGGSGAAGGSGGSGGDTGTGGNGGKGGSDAGAGRDAAAMTGGVDG